MLEKTEGKRRRGRQRMSWLDSVTDSMAMSLSKLQWTAGDRGAWGAAVRGGHRIGHASVTEQKQQRKVDLFMKHNDVM